LTTISGNIVDVLNGETFPGTLTIEDGRITDVTRDEAEYGDYILPGFVDTHVHVESSMLTPAEFARAAVIHGTVGTVSDPHEIANVLGRDGIEFMLESAARTPFKFHFGAPSCVPASPFETSGASLGPEEVAALLDMEGIGYLAEVMNYPGAINADPEVHAKLDAARQRGMPIDGHAPGVRGEALEKYFAAGITTDHECFGIDEAREKLGLGMKILIREGSAAKNMDELLPLLVEAPEACMLCSDDKHPDDLVRGHVNLLVKRAVDAGIDTMNALRAACVNPVLHYGLDVGLLRPGDPADLIVVDDLASFNVRRTYIGGELVAENGKTLLPRTETSRPNAFAAAVKSPEDFRVEYPGGQLRVIGVVEGQLVTQKLAAEPKIMDGDVVSDVDADVLKIAVVNRYADSPPAVAFVKGFGLRRGAIASSVAHDSHNVIAVGTDDAELCRAINCVVEARGGICAVDGDEQVVLPLPIAGLMSDSGAGEVARLYEEVDAMAKRLGSVLHAPFMTLSFMALAVIPSLKLTDKGLFDGDKFQFTELFTEG